MTPPKRRPRGTGSLTYRASDGMWIGRVDAGWAPQGTRWRPTVSSKDRDVAAWKLDRLVRQVRAGKVKPPVDAPSQRATGHPEP